MIEINTNEILWITKGVDSKHIIGKIEQDTSDIGKKNNREWRGTFYYDDWSK